VDSLPNEPHLYTVHESNVPRFTVVVIEDTIDDEALTIRALRRTGLPILVKTARDGARAVAMLTQEQDGRPPELPQLVLLDLKLPLLNGLEVLRKIREDERTALVPVVCLSSSDEESDLVQAYALGATSFVRKPVDFERYMYVVGRAAEYWLDINLLPRGERRGTSSFQSVYGH
jgi:two-component system response regulator